MTSEEYVKMQKMWLEATGVKKGSWVRVTRNAVSGESGWNNLWDVEMTKSVGKVLRVTGACVSSLGIELAEPKTVSFRFPFFVLDLAEAPKPEKYQFKPFEQVLVRNNDNEVWCANVFSRYVRGSSYSYECVNCVWEQCIPYAWHEHLLGTTNAPVDLTKDYDKE